MKGYLMYYLQKYQRHNVTWTRDHDEGEFDTPLEALERRDEIRAEHQEKNDGIERGCRVVSDDGDVVEYGVTTC